MAYTTYTEVQGDFRAATFTTTSNVTTTDITQFIVEADALINSYVGMRYSTPVTAGTDALALLKLCSRSLVAERIRGILAVKQVNAKDAEQNVRSGLSTRDIMKILEGIRDGNTLLDGATLKISGGAFHSSNHANDIVPTVTKDDKLW